MTGETLRSAAEKYEAIAGELETAARHTRVSVGHLCDGKAARLRSAGTSGIRAAALDELAVFHASRSRAEE